MNSSDRTREHFRVVYPVAARPILREFGAPADHRVANCSERGVRFVSGEARTPSVGSVVEGTIVFPDGSEVRVAGEVVWTWQAEVALHLTVQPIPFTTIIRQQRYLRQNFPLSGLIG